MPADMPYALQQVLAVKWRSLFMLLLKRKNDFPFLFITILAYTMSGKIIINDTVMFFYKM
jgi:hypothetical protein